MRIVMDEAGDIPKELVESCHITTIPVNVMFGTEEFLTGITIDHHSFYEKVKEVGDHNFPKTAQPTPFQFVETFRSILDEGEDEILTITVGSKLSGTHDSAEAAAKELEGQGKYYLFDSRSGSAAQGIMAVEAARMAEEGSDAETILTRLREMRDKQQVIFLIDSLEYAVKGGRVSSLQSLMAGLLKIKPIMQLQDGLIVEAGKVRTYTKALNYIVDLIHERVGEQSCRIAYIHAEDHDGVLKLQERARPRLNISEEFITDMSVPVAINLGPGALGIVAIPS